MRKYEAQLFYNEFKKVDLVDFIQKESKVAFEKVGERWRCLCPMPFHKDSAPSFFVYKTKNNNGMDCWLFHCFGCGSSGTIIDFCMGVRHFDYPSDALLYLSEKLGIKASYELIAKAIKEARVDSNIKKKIDSEHYIASRMCYRLLRKNIMDEKINKWVAKSYWKMNKMLKEEDFRGIEKISIDASHLFDNPEIINSFQKE